jgi:CDP-diacylglycerol--serine O-phosphatidyltransferase
VVRSVLLVLILLSCWIMVSEVPMFALKFKHYGWRGNGIRYSFVLLSAAVVVVSALLNAISLAPAVIVVLYVLASLLTQHKSTEENEA